MWIVGRPRTKHVTVAFIVTSSVATAVAHNFLEISAQPSLDSPPKSPPPQQRRAQSPVVYLPVQHVHPRLPSLVSGPRISDTFSSSLPFIISGVMVGFPPAPSAQDPDVAEHSLNSPVGEQLYFANVSYGSPPLDFPATIASSPEDVPEPTTSKDYWQREIALNTSTREPSRAVEGVQVSFTVSF
jgi:hypothetical protein